MTINNVDKQAILKILEYCNILINFCKDKDSFKNISKWDELALSNCISQIGELIYSTISNEFKDNFTNIEWVPIVRMRHKLVHHYDSLDLDIVYDVVKNEIPILKKQLQEILNRNASMKDTGVNKMNLE